MIEVLRLGFDAMDAFRTVAHDPNWPYIVGALRLLIRTFVKSLPTNAGCNGLSSTKPFPEAMLLQARNSVDLHVRDPTFPGTRVAVNGLSTSRVVPGNLPLARTILDTLAAPNPSAWLRLMLDAASADV